MQETVYIIEDILFANQWAITVAGLGKDLIGYGIVSDIFTFLGRLAEQAGSSFVITFVVI